MNKKVAIGSSDGKVINAHFGRTPQFLIFYINQDGYNFVEVRENSPGCSNLETPKGSMEDTIQLIKDCDYVLTSRIGPAMINRLEKHGITAKILPDIIPNALEQLISEIYN